MEGGTMTVSEWMNLAPVEWEAAADRLSSSNRGVLARELEGVAERAATLARYVDGRYGAGCGDQGHATALKAANKAGHLVWCKAFGYNAHHGLTV